VNRYAAVLPNVMLANQNGFRLVLPSCFQVPLGDERAIAIAVHADRAPEQSRCGRPAPQSPMPSDAERSAQWVSAYMK
jgi:hypothetical protein